MIFPVWWWSMPAVLKGWIDRVWNFGYAYGTRFYPHKKVWMIGVAGTHKSSFAEGGYDTGMRILLETGILGYCHIEEARFEVLYGSVEGEPYPSRIIQSARVLGAQF